MDKGTPRTLADSIAAAQAWWRQAGVDLSYHDEPQAWLAEEASEPVAVSPPRAASVLEAKANIGGERTNWPGDLAAFSSWWLDEPSLDPATRGRVPPRGVPNAAIMVVVPMPEAEDREVLLSGPQGRLLANMVRAMGVPADQAYFASALPRHIPLPDWPELTANGMGDLLRHHIGLVAPQRLIVLGRDVLPLLGHDPAQAAPAVSELSIQSGKLPWLSSYAPGRLLDHPRYRAQLWRRWLEWTGTGH